MQKTIFKDSKEAIQDELVKEMQVRAREYNRSTVEKLAIACRFLSDNGHGGNLAGQVSVRADEPGSFYTNDFVYGFSNTTRANIIKVNSNLEVIEGEGLPNPGMRFHLWIYRERPEINAIVHAHPPHTAALSMLGRELVVSHMDTCMFHSDCGFLGEWPGVPIGNEEGRIISTALGDNKSVLLAHHGFLTTGDRLEEAVYLAYHFEHAARLQLLSEAAGAVKPVSPSFASEAHDFLLNQLLVDSTFEYWSNWTIRKHPNLLSA